MTEASRAIREAAAFVRYGAVGVLGFAVDAGVLQILVADAGVPPIPARGVSFAVAVLATFWLNRRWTFAGAGPERILAAFVAYLGVQGAAFAMNFLVYAAWVVWIPAPWSAPILALAAGSAVGLVVNYGGARFVVFARPRGEVGPRT